MLNIRQSIVLEYYFTDELIPSYKHCIVKSEKRSKISILKTNSLKYIGRVVNFKNNIIDHLHNLMIITLHDIVKKPIILKRPLKVNFNIDTLFKDLDCKF